MQAAFGGAHQWFSGTMADVTEAQANFVPPGIAHPIGELAAHVVHSEDGYLYLIVDTNDDTFIGTNAQFVTVRGWDKPHLPPGC